MSVSDEFTSCAEVEKSTGDLAALIFKRVNYSGGAIQSPEIIPELLAVKLNFTITTPTHGRIIKRDSTAAQVVLKRDGAAHYLIEITGTKLQSLSDEQIEAEAEDFWGAYADYNYKQADSKSRKWRSGFVGYVEINGGTSAWLSDLDGWDRVDSLPSWKDACGDVMAKAWPKLASATTPEDRELAYYIDRARHFGADAPSEIKQQIASELRTAKNAHRRRTGKKHKLALEILSRWHEVAEMTTTEIHEALNADGVSCTAKAIERELSRLKIKRPVDSFRPNTKF